MHFLALVDLLALATCLGALSCRLWVLPPACTVAGTGDAAILLAPVWRLLAVGLAALLVSSAGTLIGRAMRMSGLPLSELLPVLPTVLFHTHYGRLWLIRLAALTALGIGWWAGGRRLQGRVIPGWMLGGGVLIALTRSMSGHAADWGDLTLPELMDGLHLLAASLWGGGLLSLASTVLPAARSVPVQQRTLLADIARRFSRLAGITLMVTMPTGLYNAWLHVGTFQALWQTPYGRALLVKLLFVLPLLTLGASNRYITVPLLQRWANRPLAQPRLWRVSCLRRFLAVGRRTPRGEQLAQQLQRKVAVEVIIVVGVLLCTAFLLQGIPARHARQSHSTSPRSPVYHATWARNPKRASYGRGFCRMPGGMRCYAPSTALRSASPCSFHHWKRTVMSVPIQK
jgi:putative copper resistance protein D